MKKFIIFTTILALFASCREWEPVGTLVYPEPDGFKPVTDIRATHTIAQLAAMYTPGTPITIDKDIIIEGKVSTSDKPGNFYKSFYIQDATGGMEIKIGISALYNLYKPGQTVYVKCEGLTVGSYGYKTGMYGGSGMVQLGCADPNKEYENSSIDLQLLIDTHIFRGKLGEELTPEVISESDLPGSEANLSTCKYLGKLVTLKGLKYDEKVFVLMNINSRRNKKESSNRVFLSDKNWGITTWAMSKTKYLEYLNSGVWDDCLVGNGNDHNYGSVKDHKDELRRNASAYPVSHYFKMGSHEVQIRTSGFSRFSDVQIDPAVLNGSKTIDVTGILTLYQGKIQFLLNDITGVKVN